LLTPVLDTAWVGNRPFPHASERYEDIRVLLGTKKTLFRRRTVWRWTVEWSGVGRRRSKKWLSTQALAEEAGLEAWSRWWEEGGSPS